MFYASVKQAAELLFWMSWFSVFLPACRPCSMNTVLLMLWYPHIREAKSSFSSRGTWYSLICIAFETHEIRKVKCLYA
jgi:hypothetical protein